MHTRIIGLYMKSLRRAVNGKHYSRSRQRRISVTRWIMNNCCARKLARIILETKLKIPYALRWKWHIAIKESKPFVSLDKWRKTRDQDRELDTFLARVISRTLACIWKVIHAMKWPGQYARGFIIRPGEKLRLRLGSGLESFPHKLNEDLWPAD